MTLILMIQEIKLYGLLIKKRFSVKSLYLKCSSLDKVPFWFIWKARIPPKNKSVLVVCHKE
jgi:hypothetical protein